MSAALHGDVASAIGQQVEQMILQAKKDSEARVRHDLSVARSQLKTMEGAIQEMEQRVAHHVRNHGSSGAQDSSQNVDKDFLTQKVAQLEAKWGAEVKALKQDLHRTILAHNHNSDLMRHHRDALDEARRNLESQIQPKDEQVDAQLEKVDRMVRAGQAKQRALESLTERLASLEQQVGDMLPVAAANIAVGATGLPAGAATIPSGGPCHGQLRAETGAAAKKKEGEPPADGNMMQKFLKAPVFVPRNVTQETAKDAAPQHPESESGSDAEG